MTTTGELQYEGRTAWARNLTAPVRDFLSTESGGASVMVVATVDFHTTQVVGQPRVITRGWVHAPEAEDLLEEAATVVGEALAKSMADGVHDVEVLGRAVRRALGAFVSERTRRRPLIIPVVLAV